MADMRVYLRLESLQRQFAAYLATPVRGRGYVPLEGMHSLIVEIAPALAIHRVTDLALKSVPDAEPGILYVERQFGILEVHSFNPDDLEKTRQWFLKCNENKTLQASIENRQVNKKTGEISTMLWTSNFHFDSNNQITLTTGMFQNFICMNFIKFIIIKWQREFV